MSALPCMRQLRMYGMSHERTIRERDRQAKAVRFVGHWPDLPVLKRPRIQIQSVCLRTGGVFGAAGPHRIP
jgi:hypothetical protein